MNPRSVILSTGAEANECALRYAKHIKEKDGIISFDRAYHGQSHGTAAYSMSRTKIRPRIKHSFETPFPVNCYGKKDYDVYINEFEKIISKNQPNIAAAIFEPIVSGGGLLFADKYYFKNVRNICDKYGIFLIFDECQTGFARTGTWFYYQQMGVVPDFLVSAKAIGLGYPVSCVMVNGHTVKDELFVMEHYSSHQNEPFAARLINFGIDYIKSGNILKQNSKNGTYLLQNLKNLAKKHSIIVNPRGKGLMCGFDLMHKYQNMQGKEFGTLFCKNALKYKVIIQHCNNGRTIRILPGYIIKKEDIDFFTRQVDAMITECF
jgi:4-aminobutyrate aminotransferase-like enzyme